MKFWLGFTAVGAELEFLDNGTFGCFSIRWAFLGLAGGSLDGEFNEERNSGLRLPNDPNSSTECSRRRTRFEETMK